MLFILHLHKFDMFLDAGRNNTCLLYRIEYYILYSMNPIETLYKP